MRECLLGVGIAALVASAVAFAPMTEVAARWTSSGATDARPIDAAFTAIYADSEDEDAPANLQKASVRLASAATDVTGTFAPAGNAGLASSLLTDDGASFRQRFYSSYGDRSSSFEERFGLKADDREPVQRAPATAERPVRVDASRRTRLAMLSPATDPAPGKPARPAAEPDPARTAIYDISARTVYLPNGDRLEAHSGFGEYMDDVRSVRLKMRGVTPPNVYQLTERERPFHGVRAIRLNPVDGDKMYGRAGILAHSYLLGPNGQSNGCVSIKDYQKFLNAFLNGEIDRLVVVEQLAEPPPANTAVGWITDKVKAFFKSS